MFAANNVIPRIHQGFVIQNVQLKDKDEELLKMNYVELVRNDMETNDHDMRRRIVVNSSKGLLRILRKG